ncbi:PAAT ABC transporter permease [Pontimonas salivibrio]|uniref:PAAT ABC transporter permease n=2 Tax=Pontimonas salivibrio TaxID=1159327 RepID=A0A2L2BQ77_9MICO|nr:PAAT ABC transporter permease [Pontimonas salivibrio]
MVWFRRNLFRTWWDGVLTLVFGGLSAWVIWSLVEFIFITGRWEIIEVNLKLLLVGQFPGESLWMVEGSLIAITFWLAAALGGKPKPVEERRSWPTRIRDIIQRFGLIIGLGILLVVLAGPTESAPVALGVLVAIIVGRLVNTARHRVTWLKRVPTPLWHLVLLIAPIALISLTLMQSELSLWGGFLINFYMAIIAIVLCFPLGVLLALGRKSTLPIVRLISTTYIELIRGAPLFVLLLLAGVALEFFIPSEVAPGSVFRAVTVFTLFTAAYLAEIVRGGLQSIPKGQLEAGKALGLSTAKITFLITLPQALRNVIPAQIGQFISLFKDTTLAGAALSIVELLKVSEAVTKQDDFLGQGYIYEALTFVSLLFWVGSYVMSRESQRLEKRLGVGQR